MKDLAVVIVGGGAGLGAEVAAAAASGGACAVGIIDLDETAAKAALEPAETVGAKTFHTSADIGSKEPAHEAFNQVVAAFGRVDTLVNCAAIYPRLPVMEIDDEDWDALMAVNIKGTYHMMVAAAAHMARQQLKDQVRGRIVNISSVDAFKAHPQNAHYAASKAAVVSLTRSFAHELASDSILVNSVAPAGMATEKARAAGFLAELAAASPLGRAATPAEICEWVMMAGGPRNTYMTGENIIVSGGYIYA